MTETTPSRPTLVLGGTGKTARRLVERLTRWDISVRIGSRSAGLPFEWAHPKTWGPAFQRHGRRWRLDPVGPAEPGDWPMSLRSWQVVALLPATVTVGLTADVFRDWAHTFMRGLHKTDDRTFVGAFQALDDASLNPLF